LRNRAPKQSPAARAEREAQRRACKAIVEVGLYNFKNAFDPEHETAWFQPLPL
jgi:hypothetical protein